MREVARWCSNSLMEPVTGDPGPAVAALALLSMSVSLDYLACVCSKSGLSLLSLVL